MAEIPLSSVVAMLNATALAIHGSTSERDISDNLRVGITTRPSSVCATSRVVVAGIATASGSTVSESVAPAIVVSAISL
jgi:orotate phosphoribosyltransferase-like protein